LEAAAKVHTDFAKNFVKVEVISAKELIEIGGWQKAKEKGKILLEGRDYQVKDGDVLEFRASVK
jgi:ribosome-binding ATPase YchF (GTP1/OBG family)